MSFQDEFNIPDSLVEELFCVKSKFLHQCEHVYNEMRLLNKTKYSLVESDGIKVQLRLFHKYRPLGEKILLTDMYGSMRPIYKRPGELYSNSYILSQGKTVVRNAIDEYRKLTRDMAREFGEYSLPGEDI